VLAQLDSALAIAGLANDFDVGSAASTSNMCFRTVRESSITRTRVFAMLPDQRSNGFEELSLVEFALTK